MKKGLRKITAVTSVLAVSGALLAGCGGSNESSENGGAASATASPTGAAASASASPSVTAAYDVSVALWDVGKNLTDPAADKLLKTVEDKTNLTFKAKAVTWNDYKEKFNLWAASGELPDMFVTDFRLTPTVDTWIKQGLIRALPDDLSAYPNLHKVMELEDVKPLAIDGKFYFVPRLSKLKPDEYATERGFIVRKDWMDTLGIQKPATFEQYDAMFQAFAKNDPDKNGKNDTIGLTHNFNDVLGTTLALGSAVPNIKGWVQENGQWIPSLASQGMYDYLTKFKKLYDDGALDKDFAILKTNDGSDKFATGNVGALAIQTGDNTLKMVKDKWDKANPGKSFEDSITILPVWPAPDGNTYRFYSATAYSDIYFSAKVDDQKMDAILKFIDFNLSEEGKDLYAYGFEGEDYKKEGNKIVPVAATRVNYPSYNFFFYLNGIGHGMETAREAKYAVNGQKLVDMAYDNYDKMLQNAKPIPINFGVEFISTPAKNKFQSVIATYMDDITKIILDKGDTKAAWDKQIKTYKSLGLDDAIKEVNAAVAQQGIQ
ncbi:putative aldouronate transport system substrate-binding protein [Cohnella sp. OV330]|uniref:extracellular solute-binding protein n=1 Tax=Cohnella sp. OV330 TaxID=1855288 RepID=UPI0008F1A04B|nr:extracellular solute-binding protein [Cohnella sp. OV330]SFA98286.1 putative aldouronate transport system substrate-binding protein [Cohnella sp. OV330]